MCILSLLNRTAAPHAQVTTSFDLEESSGILAHSLSSRANFSARENGSSQYFCFFCGAAPPFLLRGALLLFLLGGDVLSGLELELGLELGLQLGLRLGLGLKLGLESGLELGLRLGFGLLVTLTIRITLSLLGDVVEVLILFVC